VTIKRVSVLLTAAGFVLALSATAGLTCDDHKQAAETADAKSAPAKGAEAKALPAADTEAAVPPCCAKKAAAAKQTAGVQGAKGAKAAKAVPAVATAGCDKPCDGAAATADGAGCPKKAAPATTATVAQETGKDH